MKKLATILLIALAGCNPAKKLLQEQDATTQLKQNYDAEKKAIAAEAVALFVKNNPCPAMPEVNLDSLCSIYYQCPDDKNTTAAADYFYTPPKRIMVPYEDTRTITLLKDSCVEKDKRLAVSAALIGAAKAQTLLNIKEAVHTKNIIIWILIAIALLQALIIVLIAKR